LGALIGGKKRSVGGSIRRPIKKPPRGRLFYWWEEKGIVLALCASVTCFVIFLTVAYRFFRKKTKLRLLR